MRRASWLVIVGVMACGPGKAPPAVNEPALAGRAAQGAGESAGDGAAGSAGAGAAGSAGAAKGQAGAEAEPRPPALRLPGGARPLRYDVELAIDPAREDFAGTIAMELELAAETRVLWLNAVGIAVESATFESGGGGGGGGAGGGGGGGGGGGAGGGGASGGGGAGGKIAARAITRHEGFLGLVPERPLAAGRARLTIAYRGKAPLNDGQGIYTFEDGGARYAVTQFEATDARRAFPCFDEPAYKVPWRLALRTPKDLVALANTPALGEQVGADGMKTVRFAETRPMPSYLVAFAIGPFELIDAGKARGGAPIRVAVPRGHGAEAAFPAQVARTLLERIEDYFGIRYPYEKLDLVAVPVYNGGAMENAGLITFRQSLLLAKRGEETLAAQQELAALAAHEIAHHWFGDYVTMAWWDDVWLNEAFATWMAAKVVEQWRPAWSGPAERVAIKARAMAADSLDAARAIRQPIAGTGDIVNAFDEITYQKGAAVIAMIERWIGPEAFQRGVRAYLAQHAWGNATYASFAAAISAASGRDLGPVLDSFVQASGVPLVSAELACPKGSPPRLVLSQERYRPRGSPIDPKRSWRLPVCVRWGAGAARGRDCTVLEGERAELPLSARACPDWVLPNEASAGYYRARLGGDLLDRLLARAWGALSLPERAGLVDDVRALAGSGDLAAGVALALADRLAKDGSRHLVEAGIGLVAGIDSLVPPELRPAYERLIGRLFRARAAGLGWQPRGGETDDTRQLRPALLELVAGEGRDRALGAQATALAWRWLDDRKAIDPELVATALAVAARRGDRRLLDRLVAEAKRTPDRVERERLLDAVGAFAEPELARRAMGVLLDPELDLRDALGILHGGLGHLATREIAYRFVVDNFDALASRLPLEYRPSLASALIAVCDEARKAEAEAFFRPRIEKYDGGPHVMAQALERVSLCAARRRAQVPEIAAYLKQQ